MLPPGILKPAADSAIACAMQGVRRTGKARQALAWAVIACALLLRVAVPQGWMPSASTNGWGITICTGMGPMRMAMPGMAAAPHGSHGRDHDEGGDHPCAFSSLALAIDEPPLLVLALPIPAIAGWVARFPVAIAVGRGLAAPPPPATGPPLA